MDTTTIFSIETDGEGRVTGNLRPGYSPEELATALASIGLTTTEDGKLRLNILIASVGLALAQFEKPVADQIWDVAREQCDAVRKRNDER